VTSYSLRFCFQIQQLRHLKPGYSSIRDEITETDIEAPNVSMRDFVPLSIASLPRGGISSVPADVIVTALGLLADIRACQETHNLAVSDARAGIRTCEQEMAHLVDVLGNDSTLRECMATSKCPLLPSVNEDIRLSIEVGSETAFRCELVDICSRISSTERELKDFLGWALQPPIQRRKRQLGDTTSERPCSLPAMGLSVAAAAHVSACVNKSARNRASSLLTKPLSQFIADIDWWSAERGHITSSAVECYLRIVNSAAAAAGHHIVLLNCLHALCMPGGRAPDDALCSEFTTALNDAHLTKPVMCVTQCASGAYVFVAVVHDAGFDTGSIVVAHPLRAHHAYRHESAAIAETMRAWIASCQPMRRVRYRISYASPTLVVPAVADPALAGPYALAYSYFFAMQRRFPADTDLTPHADKGIRLATLFALSTGQLLRPVGEDFVGHSDLFATYPMSASPEHAAVPVVPRIDHAAALRKLADKSPSEN
jgi:hypothetical protein